ncbi:DUF4093 domain-containing protein, partial [Lacticaseibacillus nasuensis]|uniref:DUF4093 domain-containing protein n=1 Tax=Lacticaseibacillus nasuensis TaxID=944671 RepID=UPI000B084CB6
RRPSRRARRERLGELLHIGYTNGKQLQKRLRQFAITPAQFAAAVAQLEAS